MGMFFNYDGGKNRHSLMGMPVENQKGEVLGYRPHVSRAPKDESGFVEVVSDRYPQIKWQVYETAILAREAGQKFFISLEYKPENEIILENLKPDHLAALAAEPWEKINKELAESGGVNPTAYKYGFLAGFKLFKKLKVLL